MDWTEDRYTLETRLAGGTRPTVPSWTLDGLVGCEVRVIDVREYPQMGYGTAFALITDQGFTLQPDLLTAKRKGDAVAKDVQGREVARRSEAALLAQAEERAAVEAFNRLVLAARAAVRVGH